MKTKKNQDHTNYKFGFNGCQGDSPYADASRVADKADRDTRKKVSVDHLFEGR
jgi:hypothetical protein